MIANVSTCFYMFLRVSTTVFFLVETLKTLILPYFQGFVSTVSTRFEKLFSDKKIQNFGNYKRNKKQ